MNAAELDCFLRLQVAENPVLEMVSASWEHPVGLGLSRIKDRTHSLDVSDPRGELLLDISLSSCSVRVKKAATVLADSLDNRGFLPDFTPQFAKEVGFDLRTLTSAKELLQTLGVPGFGAHNLAESLLLQLRHKNQLTALAEKVVSDYLPLVGSRIDRLASTVGASLVELQQVLEHIRACNPCPGSRYCRTESVANVIPDVYIVKSHEGFEAYVNQSLASSIIINDSYRQMAEQARDGNTKSYIDDCMRNALWMFRAVEQRRETLQKIAQTLIIKQYAFLAYGTAYLRPLTLAAVAAEVGVHESTVSRAVAHKHALTTQGLVPLKAFFDSGVRSRGGEMAAEAVKERIVRLINQEDKSSPLSDEQIASLLKADGIHISRRTVAKYRESLDILSSAGRRRYDIMG